MRKINLKKENYSKHFLEFLKSNHRYQILFGGRGSGKTHHIIVKLLYISFLNQYNHIVYVNKIFGDIRKNQFKDIIKIIKLLKLQDYFTINKTNYGFKNNITGTEFTALGMDNAENTKGLSDPTIIWWDEINKGTQEDFTTLNALLRTPLNKTHQFIISFNPVSETHWLRSYFFDKSNTFKINADFYQQTYLNHSTYLHNDFIDKDEYLKTLQLNALGNTNRMLVDIEGRWGLEQNNNPFFYALNRDLHYKDERYNLTENSHIYLSFDFNKDPLTLVVSVLSKERGIEIIDLIATNPNTRDGLSPLVASCRIFKEKYMDSGIVEPAFIQVTGDASGKGGGADKKANFNFFTTIQQELRINKYQIKTRKANTTHLLSQEICNNFIYSCNFSIYYSAKLVYEDMFNAQIVDGSLKKDKDNGMHFTDAVRYLIDRVLMFDEWKNYLNYYKKRIEI